MPSTSISTIQNSLAPLSHRAQGIRGVWLMPVLLLILYRLGECSVSCFIQALVLVFQFCPQLVYLSFNQSEGSIGFLDELMVMVLWSSRNKDIFSVDAGQCVKAIAYALQRSDNIATRL